MSTGVAFSNLGDLLNTTIPHMPRMKFSETQKYTDNPLVRLLFETGRFGQPGGVGFQARIRLRAKSTARNVKMYQGMKNQQEDLMGVIEAPVRYTKDRVVFDQK